MPIGVLSAWFEETVDRRTYARGEAYYREGRVARAEQSAAAIDGIVVGTRPYEVCLALDARGLYYDCDCPVGRGGSPCKHTVALAWYADATDATLAMVEADLNDEGTGIAPRRDAGPSWALRLRDLHEGADRRRSSIVAGTTSSKARFELWIDPERSRREHGLWLLLMRRTVRKEGDLGEARPGRWASLRSYTTMPYQVQSILLRLHRMSAVREYREYGWGRRHADECLRLDSDDAANAVRLATDVMDVRCLDPDGRPGPPLAWSETPWQFELALSKDAEDASHRVAGRLTRPEASRSLDAPRLLLRDAIVVFEDSVAPLNDCDAFEWIGSLRRDGPIVVPDSELEAFLPRLMDATLGLPLDLGPVGVKAPPPTGVLDVQVDRKGRVAAALAFAYDGETVSAVDPSRIVPATEARGVMLRDDAAERRLIEVFESEGGNRTGPEWVARPYALPPDDLATRLARLIEHGFRVLLEERPLRTGGTLNMRVKSGIDWFDLEGEATFDTSALELPEILQAVSEGRRIVTLEDGGAAVLPPEWVGRLEVLGALGGAGETPGALRVDKARAPLLDVLLANLGHIDADAAFTRLRTSLRGFKGIRPKAEPKAFRGELRAYQREALGWFAFLRRAGLGGCLADDMGLGKTVQVLACLAARRRSRTKNGPSLVVAPRSVMSNWVREAARFAPTLRTAAYHGPDRGEVLDSLDQLDLIVTTYGTMRIDVEVLRDIRFDYVVLDESQAIKNASSKTARAACRLDARHRLALSGTPIENHLDELGSLFAFLNPGLFGTRREFQRLVGGKREHADEHLAWIQAAIRPVVLRRTREQVLTELPEKEEQILRCPLGAAQRAAYEDIREHYRASVLERVESRGLARSKMHVLEALLRLRQAACHPGLIDRGRRAEGAAKLDVLLPMLVEIAEAGHKALVFSQFTKLLSIVRDRLDSAGLTYAYMDGRTRKRAERIDRFQSDPDISAFLISLKAGGTGLNLTAAQYVFLLDPWWNPAVEAQAVGRAHRMGQEQHVTVYRLIGEDTVEERVLELQTRKRELVQAVLGGVSDAPLRDISRDDLECLLG